MKAVAHSVSAQTLRVEGPQHNAGDSRIAAPVSRSLHGDKMAICIGLSGHGNAIPGHCGCDKMSRGFLRSMKMWTEECHLLLHVREMGAGRIALVRRK